MEQYLALEDATLIYQLQVWRRHPDIVLSDLAARFLTRDGLAAIDDPVSEKSLGDARAKWEKALQEVVAKNGFVSAGYYALRDDLKLTVYDPYIPEKEESEQDPYNAIFIAAGDGGAPREISRVLERLGPVTGPRGDRYRYYVPKECRDAAKELAASGQWQ